jgi:hypothetical protein
MNDYMLLMHAGARLEPGEALHTWPAYFARLREVGAFQGGSAIADGICVSKAGGEAEVARHITGYVRIRAASLDAARALLAGNPVYEAGGTVEIRELPRTS